MSAILATLSPFRHRGFVAAATFHPAFRSIYANAGHPWPSSTPGARRFSRSPSHRNYEGDGKTTITILNHEIDSPLMVDGYHENGFRLNNGFNVRGPMAIFPKSVLAWDVASAEKVTLESLILFTLLEPKLDVLIIGVGDTGKQIPRETIIALQKKRINFEILTTEHALATFNFLNFERRCVAAALLPPTRINYGAEDLLRNRMDKKLLYDPNEMIN